MRKRMALLTIASGVAVGCGDATVSNPKPAGPPNTALKAAESLGSQSPKDPVKGD